MAGSSSWSSLMCKECNKKFMEKKDQQKHYKSEWHRNNLKLKMAGFPGVTEAVFFAKSGARVSQDAFESGTVARGKKDFDKESDEREKFDQTVDLGRTIYDRVKMDGVFSEDDDEDNEVVVDPCCCFMCDKKHKSVERCMVHMHKHHGLFIPDIEFLKDPQGLFTYLPQKVKREYTCLYCNINCQPFESLEAVRMHMVAKSHCRVHYGDATDEQQEPELDEFYDYSTSYIDGDGNKQLISTEGMSNYITLGCGGSELVITRENDEGGVSTKAIGSREYLRYYRQKPRPSQESVPVTSLKAAKHRSISLSTLELKEKMERMKLMNQIMKQMKRRSGPETMRCMRSNPTRNFRPMNAIH